MCLSCTQVRWCKTWFTTPLTRRVGPNRVYTLHMTVYLVISLPKIPYIHRIYIGLARTVYIHRIWPYIWWFSCPKYRVHTLHMTVYLVIFLPKIPYICMVLARTIYIRRTYGIFGLKITKYTVYVYVYIRFWPTLDILSKSPASTHTHYKCPNAAPPSTHSAAYALGFVRNYSRQTASTDYRTHAEIDACGAEHTHNWLNHACDAVHTQLINACGAVHTQMINACGAVHTHLK